VARFGTRVASGAPNALSQLLAAKHAVGKPILDLTLGNPTMAGLVYPPDIAALPAAPTYQPDPRGLRGAREAVAADYARRGARVDPEHVFLSASTSEAYAWLFKLLADPGDVVLAPEPSYPLHAYLAALEGVTLLPYPLAYDGVWHIDFAALKERIGGVRAVLAVSPGNPIGAYLKRDEHARLLALCAAHDCALICDEVFAEYPASDTPDEERASFAAVPDAPALVFSLGGLSKSAGLPQLKLAWTVVAGPPAVRDQALARLELIADSYLSVATPVMLAAPRLLAAGAEVRTEILSRVRENRAALAAAMGRALLPAEGGWYGVLRLPGTRSDEELALALLGDHDVLVHPGYLFDFPRGTYLVVSLLPPPEAFRRGVEAILSVT
jgi:alanine-synthesizing transaminase